MTKRQLKRLKGPNAAAQLHLSQGYRPAIYDRYGRKLQSGIPYVNKDNYYTEV